MTICKNIVIACFVIMLSFCSIFMFFGCDSINNNNDAEINNNNNDAEIKISKITFQTASGSKKTVKPLNVYQIKYFDIVDSLVYCDSSWDEYKTTDKNLAYSHPPSVVRRVYLNKNNYFYDNKNDNIINLTDSNYDNYKQYFDFCENDLFLYRYFYCVKNIFDYKDKVNDVVEADWNGIVLKPYQNIHGYCLGMRYSGDLVYTKYPSVTYKDDAAIITYYTFADNGNKFIKESITVNKSTVQVYYD